MTLYRLFSYLKSHTKIIVITSIILITSIVLISTITQSLPSTTENNITHKDSLDLQAKSFESETGSEASDTKSSSRISLAAVGDVMVHMPQLNSAYDPSSEIYDFSEHFSPIKEHIRASDLAFCNLETTLGGEELGYSGFPRFNAPDSLAKTLKETGFDVVSTANNHSLDTGEQGLLRTIDVLKENDLKPVGTHSTSKDRHDPTIIEKNGVRIGFTGYTYGTNGLAIPEGKDYLVNLIYEDEMCGERSKEQMNLEQMKNDIDRLKERQVDLIIVSMHWGIQYQRTESAQQNYLAEQLVDFGVDLILGHHPHVLQPMEKITVEQNEGTEHGYVVYSMGNFISNQRKRYRDSGVIVKFDIDIEHDTGEIYLSKINPIPTWVDRFHSEQGLEYRILNVPLELAQGQINREDKQKRLIQVMDETREKMEVKREEIYLGSNK